MIKHRSLIRKMLLLTMIQLILLVIILLSFVFVSYQSALDDFNQVSDNFLRIYGTELSTRLNKADNLLKNLIYDNTDLNLLQSDKESDRYYASINLYKAMNELMMNDESSDVLIVAESEHDIFLNAEAVRLAVSLQKKNEIRDFAIAAADQDESKAGWNITSIAGEPYVYKLYVWNHRAVGTFISARNFLRAITEYDDQATTLILCDNKGAAWAYIGSTLDDWQAGQDIDQIQMSWTTQKQYSVVGEEIYLNAYFRQDSILGQVRAGMVTILGVLLLTLAVGLGFVAFMKKDIVQPMRQMIGSMEEMQQGNYQLRISEDYHNQEFILFKQTFNQLMDEIVNLKIEQYEKQIVLSEAELRNVRLQLRPHFFLNALTTISSLSMQSKNPEIKAYIDALSKNVRYMFKSGLHTVPLKDEIRHVENYFEMQDLKYPGFVFHYIEMPEAVEAWLIPQMIIHTVIENAYKYAVSQDKLLTILIKIGKAFSVGEEMLSIEIEDDGVGYPLDYLEKMQSKDNDVAEGGHRVGLLSIRKMLEIMYDRNDLFYISNIEPHGCLSRFLIPRETVNEVRE